jgi:hypothetical protein
MNVFEQNVKGELLIMTLQDITILDILKEVFF